MEHLKQLMGSNGEGATGFSNSGNLKRQFAIPLSFVWHKANFPYYLIQGLWDDAYVIVELDEAALKALRTGGICNAVFERFVASSCSIYIRSADWVDSIKPEVNLRLSFNLIDKFFVITPAYFEKLNEGGAG